ncbi:MAG: sugar ABC transporter permease [Crenarchaeota archaeon]|nr:sugar ABC transporter permease [Thermoproteota archaeon]
MNSVIWTSGNLLLMTVVGLGGAFLLNQKLKGVTYIRNLIILPWVIPTIVVTLVWRWILEPDLGIFNNILRWFGLLLGKPIVYLGNPSLAMLTLMLVNTWKLSPFAIVIILAALQTIPKDVYEAAMIDGATGLALFRKITMPLISPILVFLGFIGFVWSFNAFDIIWLTTEGGPGTATETLPLLIFRKAFLEYRISQAASIATMVLMICLIFIVLILRRRY